MKRHITIKIRLISWIIVILLGSLFSSCINQNSWTKTNDGELLFVGNNDYTYDWEGETFDNLIHGQGTLRIFDGDSLIDSISINAYYGSINAQDVVNVNDTTKYIGDIKWKKQEGYGVLIQPHNIYVGNFTNSKPHGNLSWYQDGVLRYNGEWIEGKREGYGISYDKDGVYSGLFSNNQYKGEGEKYYKNGSSYDGEWNNGMRSGWGNLITKDISYTGDFLNGLPNGEGTLTIGDTVFTYNGNWLNGKMSQYGECTYANGDFYEGEWNDGVFNGFGVCKYANGDVYEGYWKDGLQEGDGRYVNKDFTYVGDWEGGWINGEGQMNFTNGDWYEGDFYQNERFGIGCYHFKNGNRYEGEFVNDTINGLGIFYFQDGSRYEGEFGDGKIFGDGTLHLNVNGESISITAFWDGTHNMPTEASVLFENGDLYEGELINGMPTANGVWSTQKERDEGISFGARANDFYKEHRETWNKVVIITSVTLSVVEVSAPFVCGLAGSFIPGAGTAAGVAVGNVISKVAGVANIGLNALDASMAITSAAYDVMDSYNNGEDPTDAYKTLGMEVGLNVGLVLLPKGLKKIPFGKVSEKLSKSAVAKAGSKLAKKAGTHIGKAGEKIAKTSVAKATSSITKALKNKSKNGFQKMVKIARDKSGKLEKVFLNSKTGKKANQIFKSAEKRIKSINVEVAKAREKELAKKITTKTLNVKESERLLKKNKTVKQAFNSLDPKLGVKIEDCKFIKHTDGSYTIIWEKFPETSIKIKGNIIYANAGSTIKNGNMNQFLNTLIPNKTYIIDDGSFRYVTDDMGRVVEATSDRTKAYNTLNRNKQRNSDVQKKVINDLDGRTGDDGGHLFANNTNGPNELINQVPMNHKIQANGEYRAFEQMEENAIKEGKQVNSSRKLLYEGNSKRPYAIEVTAVIDGEKITKLIKI